MLSGFFIDRPIFAWVIALFIAVLGAAAITKLPVAQYPTVAPPAIVINAAYPGASAKVLEDSVLSVIEQELNGAPGMIYMESVAQANGGGAITATFEPGTDVATGPDRGAEPPVARHAPAAGRRGAAGRAHRQGALELPAVRLADLQQPGLRPGERWATTPRASSSPSCSALPASARRSCSAPSAPCASGSTRPSWWPSACAGRCQQRHPGAERAGVGRHPG
jgi:hypothetical protein